MGNDRAVGIIPARLAATRLPDKPLLLIGGKTMIERVWERARRARSLAEVAVATPDEAIARVVERFGGRAIMTAHAHRSGTDRVAEAAGSMEADIVVNIQGDEPLLEAETIDRAVEPLIEDPSIAMSSLMCPCPPEEIDRPSTVKVVADLAGNALYFSRSTIPFLRDPLGGARVRQHIGLYAYRRERLLELSALAPTPLERTEGLEQMRALEHGLRIRMVEVASAPLSVDTPEDLERARLLLTEDCRG
ncbi:MAG TPA: 3-deoxy-manno-octulosonate cytidylyltransferase [Chthonomonadales bacterium]|nr:3-deoxy-manno-octulosonate cytidylyltransferase [Chthonomonadales bacterium]